MKRFFAFILLLTYAVTSTGTTVQMHYCMGEPSSVKWDARSGKKTCGKCGMKKQKQKRNGCCKDEHKWVKLQDDQKASTAFIKFGHFETVLSLHGSAFDFTPIISSNSFRLPQSHAPPRSCEALYKRNCVFLI